VAQVAAVAAAAYFVYEGVDKALAGHRNLEATKIACEEAESKLNALLDGVQKAHDNLAAQWYAVVVPRIPDLQCKPVKPSVVDAMREILREFEVQTAADLWENIQNE
jgi:hypothetical protein